MINLLSLKVILLCLNLLGLSHFHIWTDPSLDNTLWERFYFIIMKYVMMLSQNIHKNIFCYFMHNWIWYDICNEKSFVIKMTNIIQDVFKPH